MKKKTTYNPSVARCGDVSDICAYRLRREQDRVRKKRPQFFNRMVERRHRSLA